MGKKLISALLTLFLCLALLSGCGEGDGSPQGDSDEALTALFGELLAADYEVHYLIYSDGLAVDADRSLEENGTSYRAVLPPYADKASLKKRLEEVYARDETMEALLSAKDSGGVPRLLERDGALWRSEPSSIAALGYEEVEGSIRLTGRRASLNATFRFQETGPDGSLYDTTLSISKTARGWRLDRPRRDAERKLLREGSAQSTAIKEGTERRAAEEFLAAIQSGDLSAIAAATGRDATSWAGVRITEARISEAVEELDSYGEYQVQVTVENGAGIFPEGTQEYRLILQCDDMSAWTPRVIPVYFRPASEQYYNRIGFEVRTRPENKPAEAVYNFVYLYNSVTFETPWDLPAETVAEYAMIQARPENGGESFSPGELSQAVKQAFGLTGFDGTGTGFYVKGEDAYYLWGRGAVSVNVLIGMPKTAGGKSQVEASFYSDTLCTARLRTLRYTLEKNGDGSWRLLSAVEIER